MLRRMASAGIFRLGCPQGGDPLEAEEVAVMEAEAEADTAAGREVEQVMAAEGVGVGMRAHQVEQMERVAAVVAGVAE